VIRVRTGCASVLAGLAKLGQALSHLAANAPTLEQAAYSTRSFGGHVVERHQYRASVPSTRPRARRRQTLVQALIHRWTGRQFAAAPTSICSIPGMHRAFAMTLDGHI
jgi:hypothetical protein